MKVIGRSQLTQCSMCKTHTRCFPYGFYRLCVECLLHKPKAAR